MRLFSLIALVLFVSSLAAPARAGMVEDCAQEPDPDLGLSACTAAIQSGQLSDKALAEAYNNRGIAYSNLGDHARAIQEFDQALRLDPSLSFAFSNRGIAYSELGKYRRAFEDYDQALRLDPTLVHTRNNRGNAYASIGDYARAIADYDEALRLDPDLERDDFRLDRILHF